MAKKPNHAELEGFTNKKAINSDSWPIAYGVRLSVCTGYRDGVWTSTIRKEYPGDEFSEPIATITMDDGLALKALHEMMLKKAKEINV